MGVFLSSTTSKTIGAEQVPTRIEWGRFLSACVVLIVAFVLAMNFESDASHPEASKTLYQCVEYGFLGVFALLGVDVAKLKPAG